jgi:hypothetical protein
MGLWKDHPKEIETGGFGGDFPAPFRPAVAAAAWPPKVQEVEEPLCGDITTIYHCRECIDTKADMRAEGQKLD